MNQKGTHRRGTRPFLAQEGKGAEDRPRICRAILAGCRALQRTQGSFSRLHTHTHARALTGGGSFCVRRAWAPSRATPARHGRCYSVRCAGAIQCFQGPNDSPCVALQLYPAPPAGTRAINITGVRAVSVRWWWRWWWQRRTPGFYSIRTGRQTTRCRVLGIHNTKKGTGCVMKM